jgi:hypothetical protein
MSQKQAVKEEKKKKRLWGFEKREVSLALDKAWRDYYYLSKEQEPDKKSIMHYERVIRNLQRKLGIIPAQFREVEAIGLCFYKDNPELFKEGVTEALVKKGMIKTVAILGSGLPFDKRPNVVEDRLRSYLEWRKACCRSIRHQNLKVL